MADPDILITHFGKNVGSLMIPICSGNDECCEPAFPVAMRMLWKHQQCFTMMVNSEL